ncbi:TPR-like protein [Scleroderma citrinum]
MPDKKQQLVLSVIDFLNQSIEDGTIKQDDREGLEVAIQCIGEAFGVDPSDHKQRAQLSIKPATLQTIFEVFLKTRDKVSSAATATTTTTPSRPSADAKAKAETHKVTGNKHMNTKDYLAAIDAYTNAISLDPTNPVYYSNRAAAYSSKGDHSAAVIDSEKAIEADPSFVKGYSRLGHAHYTLGNYRAAADAYKKGLDLDPTNANLKSGLESARERIVDEDDTPPPLLPEDQVRSPSPPSASARGAGAGGVPSMAGLADMMRNMGGPGAGGPGAGGMPDFASMMNNPMFMQMAQQLMANGGMERLMSNPAMANMMNRVQSGGNLPSMDELMSDPTLHDL